MHVVGLPWSEFEKTCVIIIRLIMYVVLSMYMSNFFFRSDTIVFANEDFQKVLKNASECSSSTTNTTQWKLKLFDVVAFSGTNK